MQSKVSGHWAPEHWSDGQLIAHAYGVGPEDSHLPGCDACRTRLEVMVSNRLSVDRAADPTEISSEVIANQRRQVYAKLSQAAHRSSAIRLRRWASAAATLLVLGGGLATYEEYHQQQIAKNQISDAQLADQVSSMSQDSEPRSTAPLQALFDE